MPNAPEKQRQTIQHTDAITEGIHELDKNKVIQGLKGLRNINFSKQDTPLSPFYDLVTGIGHGREDFLGLELKHLLSIVIHHLATHVYQWSKAQNQGVSTLTQEELVEKLEALIKLSEPTKYPCITALINLDSARAIANCLATPVATEDEWWERLTLVGDVIDWAGGLTEFIGEKIEEGKFSFGDMGIGVGLSLLHRAYSIGKEMVSKKNERTLVIQLASVSAWKEIIIQAKKYNTAQRDKEAKEKYAEAQQHNKIEHGDKHLKQQVQQALESFAVYFGLNEEGLMHEIVNFFKNELPKKVLKEYPYRKTMVDLLALELEKIQELLNNENLILSQVFDPLSKIAFHALVDIYVETPHETVKCAILKVFGALARMPYQKTPPGDKYLTDILDNKRGKELEEASLRILVEAINPTALANANYPVALSLTSGKAVELSSKWKIQCAAIEELLRIDHHFSRLQPRNAQTSSPILTYLDKVGGEYQTTALLINKLQLSKNHIKSLQDFVAQAHRVHHARKLLLSIAIIGTKVRGYVEEAAAKAVTYLYKQDKKKRVEEIKKLLQEALTVDKKMSKASWKEQMKEKIVVVESDPEQNTQQLILSIGEIIDILSKGKDTGKIGLLAKKLTQLLRTHVGNVDTKIHLEEYKVVPDMEILTSLLQGKSDTSLNELYGKEPFLPLPKKGMKGVLKEWMLSKLQLSEKDFEILVEFLAQEKSVPSEDSSDQERYADISVELKDGKKASVRPVLNKLINRFNLTVEEQALIDKTIFIGGDSRGEKEDLFWAKIVKVVSNFFARDNYLRIACSYNNLKNIKKLIHAEEQLREHM